MSRRKKGSRGGKDSGPDPDAWMATYSDLVTLLLCFFVLLFSFAEVDAEKFRLISGSLKAAFDGGPGILEGGEGIIEQPIPEPQIEDKLDMDILEILGGEADLNEIYDQLREYVEQENLEELISVEAEERGVVVRFKDNVLFDSGSAEIKPGSKELLTAAAEILNKPEFIEKQIKIEGHTDSDPIVRKTIQYQTNWELSSARATNVLRYLVENEGMAGERVSSSGYSYYRPIAKNDTEENKTRNRRVDIVVLKDIYKDLEPEGTE